MFGYCDLQWQSIISPAMPPRKIVDPLAGGYRRIPVLQIGADIFCDTKLIASEIAIASNRPELAMETCSDEIREFSHYADTTIFMAGIYSVDSRKALLTVFKLFSPLQAIKFIKDRAGVQKTSSVKRLTKQAALDALDTHFSDMEAKLENNNFLFGNAPSIADFSAYHNIWFKKQTVGNAQIEPYKNIRRWFLNMSEYGHGQRLESSKNSAFEAAKSSEPRAILESMTTSINIGMKVEVSPSDYAKDSVTGLLVAEDEHRWVLSRQTTDFGAVHVHFPRQGFQMNFL